MKSWVKSGARQASGKRTFAALVLGPLLALQGCTEKAEPENTTASAATLSSALNLAQTYEKQEVPIAWRTFTGTNLSQDDDTVTTITSPFPILFAGGAGTTSVRISMNGVISFTASPTYTNAALPSSHSTLVAPFWDDLFPGASGNNVYWTVLGSEPSRELVVEWRNVLHRDVRAANPPNPLNFQVVFFEGSPEILFNYKDVIVGSGALDKGASATVGVQNSLTDAKQHSHNTASLADNTAILWTYVTPSKPPVVGDVTVSPTTLTEGDTLTVNTSFTDEDGDANGPFRVQVDTGYNGQTFTPDFGASATAQGPVTVEGVMRSSGEVTVGVRAQDKGFQSSEVKTATVTVTDVPPAVAAVTISGAATERVPVVLTSSFTDPGLDSPWKVEWDFDYDGTTFNVDKETLATQPGDISLTHGFDHDGIVTVGLRITDKDGVQSNVQSLEVSVADLTPSLTGIAGNTDLNEGGTLDLSAIFTDPGDHSKPWKVQWDFDYDGSTFDVDNEDEVETAGEIRLNRYARDSGQVKYALRVVDNDGSITEVRTIDMNIIEADPVLSPLNATFLFGDGKEPSAVSFDLSAFSGAEDPNADPLTSFLWDFDGDGSFEYASTTPYALFNYKDNPAGATSYTARVRVMDEDSYSEEQITVEIANVAPVLSAPTTAAVKANTLLALRLTAMDPGADTITYSIVDAPAGLSLTPDGLLLWTPSIRQGSGQGKAYTVTVTATDDDGGSDSKQIVLTVAWTDTDGDGMEDGWEVQHGLNPTVNDAAADRDGDGVSNLSEFLRENGGPRTPESAVAKSPLSGTKVNTAQLVLTAQNVADKGDLTDVKYQFQVFSDAALTSKVRDTTVDQEDGDTTSVSFTDGTESPDLADLLDDRAYAWRVRATDGSGVTGPWSEVQHITYNPTNDAPSAPVALNPSGAIIYTKKPTLIIQNSVDMEGDAITYTFEVKKADGTVAATGEAAAGANGTTSFTLSNELEEGAEYVWVARGKDAAGALSAPSEDARFQVYKAPEDDGGCSAGAGSLGGLLPLLAMAFGLSRRRRN